MRPVIVLSVFALVAAGAAQMACAQRGSGGTGANFGRGLPPLGVSGGGPSFNHAGGGQGFTHGRGGQGLHRGERGRGRGHDRGRYDRRGYNWGQGFIPYGYGYGYLPDDGGDAYAESPEAGPPAEQGPEFEQPPAPPVVEKPVHSSLEKYEWPAAGKATSAAPGRAASGAASGAVAETQPFGLVLKDGSTLSAEVVYASNDNLHYVDPDGRHLRIPIKEVDRTATLALNRARKLNLYLPAAE